MSLFHYAFRVAPQKELAAVDILTRRGFSAFTPVETKWRRIAGTRRRTAKDVPMMVGYVFVAFDRPEHWPQVFRFSMVKSVVGFGGRVAVLSEDQIAKLHDLSGRTVEHKLSYDSRKSSFGAGDMVTVDRKPMEVKIEEVRGKRARIIFELLGVRQDQWVPVHRLEKAA